MTREKKLYRYLCALGVLIGLYPSIFLNVKPSLVQGHWGTAVLQLVLTVITATICFIIFKLPHWSERIIAAALLLGLLRVSVANGIESVTLSRNDISSERQEKITTKDDWNTRIEKWTLEREGLKRKFIPLKGEQEYVPTSEEVVSTAREGRDAACKYPTGEACKNAQGKLEQVTQNYELTKRVDKLEHDIRKAQDAAALVGNPPPDYLEQAKKALSGAWFDPLQDREAWLAYIAEGAAAFAPKFLVFLVSHLFATELGEKWREKRKSLKCKSPKMVLTEEPAQPIRQNSLTTPKRLSYVPGVEAWVKAVTPIPGSKRKRYTPTQAHPHYRDFCEREGYPFCHVNVLGSILKRECRLLPAVTVGGCSHYEFTINEVAKLALVKAS